MKTFSTTLIITILGFSLVTGCFVLLTCSPIITITIVTILLVILFICIFGIIYGKYREICINLEICPECENKLQNQGTCDEAYEINEYYTVNDEAYDDKDFNAKDYDDKDFNDDDYDDEDECGCC